MRELIPARREFDPPSAGWWRSFPRAFRVLMLRILLVAGAALSLSTHPVLAQALSLRDAGVDSLHRTTVPTFIVTRVPSAAMSRGAMGAIVGGAVGVTAGLILGHGANIGCRLGDVHCDPKAKQVKAMVVSAALLGGVGAGIGYLAGKLWPDHGGQSRATDRRPPIDNR